MRFIRYVAVSLVAGVSLLLFACSVLIDTPEYSFELNVQAGYANASVVDVSYRATADEDPLRAAYKLWTGSDTLFEEGYTGEFSSGQWIAETYDLSSEVTTYGEGKYRFAVTVQTKNGDGSYADLAFLSGSRDFYIDSHAPEAPSLSLPAGTYLFDAGPILVDVAHPELSSPEPENSPLDFYYTLDGTLPTAASTHYSAPIQITPVATPVVVKAIAVDQAKNQSPDPGAGSTFRFLRIDHVEPESGVLADDDIFIYVHGCGFGTSPSVRILDTTGFAVYAAVLGVAPVVPATEHVNQRITVAANLGRDSSYTPAIITPGPATIEITTANPSPQVNATDTETFQIDP
jgi:hypothetical protein